MFSLSFLKTRPPVYNTFNSKYFYVYCKVEHRATKTYGVLLAPEFITLLH